MTAREVREFRTVCKKLTEVEARSKLLEDLRRNNVCLAAEEGFVLKEIGKFKILKNKRGVVQKQHDEMVSLSLKYKIKDNNLHGVKLRKKRNWLRGRIEDNLGSSSSELRQLIRDVKEKTTSLKLKLKNKNKKKVDHLIKKYGRKNDVGLA